MSTLTPDQWHEVSPYLDEALEIAAERREAWFLSSGKRCEAGGPGPFTIGRRAATETRHFLETSRVNARACLAGQKVGAYALISQIGQGGMGSVWLAQRSDGRFGR